MILNAKILTRSATFHAIEYNESKIWAGKEMAEGKGHRPGEFPAVDYNGEKTSGDGESKRAKFIGYRNFPDGLIREMDVKKLKAYLVGWGNSNTRVQHQQFHAAITCKGREFDVRQLESAAHLYMEKMGYSANPYLVYFHQDTDNNHVHIVSSRIGPDGKKISSDFEKQRSVKAIHEIGEQISGRRNITFEAAVKEACQFKFTTAAQFNMLLERCGFDVKKGTGGFSYFRNGHLQGELDFRRVESALFDKNLLKERESKRIGQIRAVIFKYATKHNPLPELRHTVSAGGREQGRLHYASKLSDYLKHAFGVDLVYHSSADKPVYGYSIIDNSSKTVFKGSDIVPLKELLGEVDIKNTPGSVVGGAESEKEEDAPPPSDRPGYDKIAAEPAEEPSTQDWFEQLQRDYLKYSQLASVYPNSEEDKKKRLKRKR